MSTEYGYIGKEVTQAFRSNKGIFTPQDIIELDQENKWTSLGQLELIQTQVASGSANVLNFTNLPIDTYNTFFLTMTGVFYSSTNKLIRLRVSDDNGSTFGTTAYVQCYQQASGSSFTEGKATNDSYINCIPNVGDELGETGHCYMYMYQLGNSTKYSYFTWHSTSMSSGGSNYEMSFGSAFYNVENSINAFQIMEATGSPNLTGTFSLYGLRTYA